MKSLIIFIILIVTITSCSKKYLEEKVSSEYEIADNLTKLAGLLNNDDLMGQTPVIGEESSDDHFLTENSYNILPIQDKNIYRWEKNIFAGKTAIPDWNIPYKQVFTCNLVLDGLSKITPSTTFQNDWNQIKGNALFMRAYALFNLMQVFAKVYDKDNADRDPGVAIPLLPDTETIPARSSMNESIQKIIGDLQLALPLVAVKVQSSSKNLPNKPAIFALMARIFLYMQDYPNAQAYADSCLGYYNVLINYNTLAPKEKFPISATNEETLYRSWLLSTSNVIQGKAMDGTIIDSVLYHLYDSNDIRKEIFFTHGTQGVIFNCNYTGKTLAFSGLATDEVYLIRAECNARLGNAAKAMSDLNVLLTNRYKPGTFTPYPIASITDMLTTILKERRKELTFRGLRWPDLKRLNKEEATNKIVLRRFIDGQSYELLPASNRYVLPIPDDAVIGNTIVQNPRD